MRKLFLLIMTIGMGTGIYASGFDLSRADIEEMIISDGYKKINAEELPPAVVESLLKDYPTSRLSQAYKNNQGKYKLVMVLKSGVKRTVYIDAYGRWLKMK